MKGIPGAIFYHQIYYLEREDEVAYCADCDEEFDFGEFRLVSVECAGERTD